MGSAPVEHHQQQRLVRAKVYDFALVYNLAGWVRACLFEVGFLIFVRRPETVDLGVDYVLRRSNRC